MNWEALSPRRRVAPRQNLLSSLLCWRIVNCELHSDGHGREHCAACLAFDRCARTHKPPPPTHPIPLFPPHRDPHRTRHRHTPPHIMRRGGSAADGITGHCVSPSSPLTTVLVIQMFGLRLLTCQQRCTCHYYAHPCLLQLRASSAMAKRTTYTAGAACSICTVDCAAACSRASSCGCISHAFC